MKQPGKTMVLKGSIPRNPDEEVLFLVDPPLTCQPRFMKG